MQKYGGWEMIKLLGEGGQSEVHLVRAPTRVAAQEKCLQKLMELSGQGFNNERARDFAKASFDYAREDLLSELGALKVFKIPPSDVLHLPPPPGSEEYEAIQRLKNEIAVLGQNRLGLPKLLGANEEERWIVTELFTEGTLEDQINKYQGKVVPALRTFRSLVSTIASLHKDDYVHRDIKPANVFVRKDDELVLGDFGIVYMPNEVERLTRTLERVGPRDYMPQWADLGERHEKVHPNFDVYMLGKLLWCMIAGRLKLPREYYRRAAFDLAAMFPNERYVHVINPILDRCVVEEPAQCLRSAQELLEIVDEVLAMIDEGVPLLSRNGDLSLPCRVCGRGYYEDQLSQGTVRLQPFDRENRGGIGLILLRLFVCNVCTHREFFAPGYPEEAAARGWTPWKT